MRQWGVPGDNSSIKAPVMNTVLQKQTSSKGIHCTLHDPRVGQTQSLENMRKTLQSGFQNIDKKLDFLTVFQMNLLEQLIQDLVNF